MASDYSLQRAAQAWCKPATEKLVMIPELAEVFAEILDEHAETIEQLRVQAAGVLTALDGARADCKQGDYGWTPAYQKATEVREELEQTAEKLSDLWIHLDAFARGETFTQEMARRLLRYQKAPGWKGHAEAPPRPAANRDGTGHEQTDERATREVAANDGKEQSNGNSRGVPPRGSC